MIKRLLTTSALVGGLAASGVWILRAQDPFQNTSGTSLNIAHAECTYFGPNRDRFTGLAAARRTQLGSMTMRVTGLLGTPHGSVSHATGVQAMSMPSAPGGSRTYTGETSVSTTSNNLIDGFIYAAFKQKGAKPAAKTNDYEFIRRVTLDLTGRIPTADRVLSFVADSSQNKRAALVDELLAKPEWLDKWTMYYGDQFKNASNWPSAGTQVSAAGRDGFNTYIRAALSNGGQTSTKPYNQMASDLIGSVGTNNFTQGELNWQMTGRVVGQGIPIQDTWDQQTANVADTFLGIAFMNCVGCHDGRGHLDTLSLWGSTFTRMKFWGFSGFMAHTTMVTGTDPGGKGTTWWANDATPKTDYSLNTTSGNRPPRQPVGTTRNVAPVYPFNGKGPNSGEGYRQAMARLVTSDFQFARASVNYLWAAFFGMGIVDPPDQFDPARLDPNNPPPDPWTLQPSNPDLLNALAQDFIDSNYDIKHVMKLIATSDTYQLESQYDPAAWNPDWQPLFARKLVRRLWGEEATDSIAQSTNIPNTFRNGAITVNWAMQLPETGVGAESATFLAAFLPGNRDDQPRRSDAAIQQALALMNDNTVMNKLVSSGTGATQSLLAKALALPANSDLINTLFLNILSRNPTTPEVQAANSLLGSATGTARTQKAQELMWTLFNKVDFMFNY
jgi:hypothetical protein